MEILLISKENLDAFTPSDNEIVINMVDGVFAITEYEKTLHQWSRAATKYSINDVKRRIFKRWKSAADKVNLVNLLENTTTVYIVTTDGKHTEYSKYMVGFLNWITKTLK